MKLGVSVWAVAVAAAACVVGAGAGCGGGGGPRFGDGPEPYTDPTYPETNLVVVRAKGKHGFKDVTLDCAGPLNRWRPVGTSGDYEYTRIDLQRHNFEKQGNCDNGRHEIKSDAPFGVTVWGWGSKESGGVARLPQAPGFYSQAVSYAYPAGMAIEPINQVFVPAIPK
jgi:hypothetical protein